MSIMGSGEAVQYALLLAVILANAPGTRLCLTESERLSLRCDQYTVQMSSANWRLRSEPRRRESALLCCRARFGWRPHRKRDREHRAATRGRRGFDVASVLAKHGLADAQAEASATAGPLGGKERIKNVRQVFRRSEEHTSELQSPDHLVCRLLLEKKKKKITNTQAPGRSVIVILALHVNSTNDAEQIGQKI